MLTKKHFEIMARTMQAAKPEIVPIAGRSPDYMRGRDDQWRVQCHALCDALEKINPKFNRETFLTYVETSNYTGTGSKSGGGWVGQN